MKYLVMECRPGIAVVLSEDGRFLKAANLHYEVGQTVTDIFEVCVPQPQEPHQKTGNRRWISALAAAAACLVLMVSFFFYGRMPYASVYMTINPQVRIDVNRSDRVVDVEGMNTDGAQLLTGYDPGRQELDAVMDELVDRAMDMGYLHEGGRITLSLEGSEAWVSSHSAHLTSHLKEHLEETISVTIDVQQKQPEPQKPVAATVPPTPAASPVPVGPIVIPVVPEVYDASDYGEDDSGYDADSDYGPSDYDDSDYGVSDVSDYGDSYGAEADYPGESAYDGADSDYGHYADTSSDYDASDYATPAPAPDMSDYDSGYAGPVPEAADSGYSDYDPSDYDGSDYDD